MLNRFLMQAAIGYPLTVHGTGGQTRAFIHIQDTVRCIELAIEHPPERGERVRIFNQMTETHRLIDLAEMVAPDDRRRDRLRRQPAQGGRRRTSSRRNRQLLDLGLQPTTLRGRPDARGHRDRQALRHRCDLDKIPARSQWVQRKAKTGARFARGGDARRARVSATAAAAAALLLIALAVRVLAVAATPHWAPGPGKDDRDYDRHACWVATHGAPPDRLPPFPASAAQLRAGAGRRAA